MWALAQSRNDLKNSPVVHEPETIEALGRRHFDFRPMAWIPVVDRQKKEAKTSLLDRRVEKTVAAKKGGDPSIRSKSANLRCPDTNDQVSPVFSCPCWKSQAEIGNSRPKGSRRAFPRDTSNSILLGNPGRSTQLINPRREGEPS